jgi:hypothetical protein
MRALDHMSFFRAKQKNWTDVFSVSNFVVHHFRRTGKEWVLDVCSKALKDPKMAHSEFLLQFGEAVALLGRDKARELGRGLYFEIMRTGLYEQTADARKVIKDHEKRMLSLYLRPAQKEITSKIELSEEKVKQLGLRHKRIQIDF